MSEQPVAAFPPPAGLAMAGEAEAGVCVDGVCAVPSPEEDAEPAD